jgi:hypothetical protein
MRRRKRRVLLRALNTSQATGRLLTAGRCDDRVALGSEMLAAELAMIIVWVSLFFLCPPEMMAGSRTFFWLVCFVHLLQMDLMLCRTKARFGSN